MTVPSSGIADAGEAQIDNAPVISIRTSMPAIARRIDSKLSSDCMILAHAGAHIRKAFLAGAMGQMKRRNSPNG
jgi:hypothetical protein